MATWKQRFNKKYGFSKDESHSIAEIARLTGYKYRNLLKIREKGIGAFYSNRQSVRPNIKSAIAWGNSRIYSAVMGGKSAKVDKDLLK